MVVSVEVIAVASVLVGRSDLLIHDRQRNNYVVGHAGGLGRSRSTPRMVTLSVTAAVDDPVALVAVRV
jgi:hypothetical protein